MAAENDLLQKFIDNEKKSKTTTLILVILFLIAAMGILYMAFNLNKKTQEINQLTSNNKEYERIIDSLSKVITRPFIIKDSINNKRTEELIQEVKVRDTLIKQVESDIDNRLMMEHSDIIQQQIQKVTYNTQEILKPQKSYTVYIQYNSTENTESRQIAKLMERLQLLGYNVPAAEYKKGTFRNTYVCYFHDEDMEFAKEVFEKLKMTYTQAIIKKKDYDAPKKQIEIWVNSLPAQN